MSVALTADGLRIADASVPVYSGTLHYWRLERALWPQILDQVQALGFRMVETYIPWSVHEIAPGEFDWGQIDERKDIEGFIELCAERGLWLIVRPGPLINAELTDFGFPEWILLDPAMQAHTAQDTLHYSLAFALHPPHQFPVPSYASLAFLQAVGRWFDAICPILARHLAPAGCIVAVQSDNETCYMFHDQAYATDYSPDSLDLYRSFLAQRYATIADLNALYGTAYADFACVQPPRDCTVAARADLPRHLDWVAYKEYQITWSVALIADMLRERGLGSVPIFHDVAYQVRTPLDVTTMEAEPAIDWVGMNFYRTKEGYRSAVNLIRYLAGSTRLPFVPEFGCGSWIHYPHTPLPQDQEFVTLSALMHGLKAFNFYMLVERERWMASPINRHAQLRPEYADLYQRLLPFVQQTRLWEYQRQPAVLVLRSYDLGRVTAALSTLHYAHVDLYGLPAALGTVEVDLGWRWDVAAEGAEANRASWFNQALDTLTALGFDYDISDTHLPLERLRRYPVLCVQAVDMLDLAAQRRLLEYAQAGGVVIIGPGLPYLDAALHPCGLLAEHLTAPGSARIGDGLLVWCAAEDLAPVLAEAVPPPLVRCVAGPLEATLHQRGTDALLFVANPSADMQTGQLEWAEPRRLRQLWPIAAAEASAAPTALTLPPYSVHIWEVRHD